MERTKRVFVSVPRDHHLNEAQLTLKNAIYEKLRSKALEPQEFHVSGLPLRAPYTFEAARDVMNRCHGVIILAFARWADPSGTQDVAMPTVWNHLEGAFAISLRKEILVITEQHVAADGITWSGGGQLILAAPKGAGAEWLESSYAKPQINAWIDAVKRVDDIFLAYSTKWV